MRNAYALLGLSFIIVFGGAYFLLSQKAEAPNHQDSVITDNLQESMSLSLTSPMFEHNGFIPSKYTCDGENINPPLSISGVPDGTKSLVLLMHDPDIPQEIKDERGIEKFDHWAIYNLPPDVTNIPENRYVGDEGERIGNTGRNSRGENLYAGPCPPPQYEPTEHRYFFKLYTLEKVLSDDEGESFTEILDAIQGSVLEEAELIGRYERVTE